MNTYYVYILASRLYGTLYIGVTNNLLGRIQAHRQGLVSKFTKKYHVNMLVHHEMFDDIEVAIQREKTMKHWVRAWKINLIERDNPKWLDLCPGLLALPENASIATSCAMGLRDKREDDT